MPTIALSESANALLRFRMKGLNIPLMAAHLQIFLDRVDAATPTG